MSDKMKYIILLIINIIFVVTAYIILSKIESKNINIKNSKKAFLIISLLYIVSLIFINYLGILSVSKGIIYNSYNFKEIKNNIFTIEKEIKNKTKSIKQLEKQLSKFKHESNQRKLEKYQNNAQELLAIQDDLSKTLSDKKNEYASLQKKYEELETKTVFKISDFPTINQFPEYPNGCEIAALYLLLHYYNINVSLEELANNLDKGPAPFTLGGISYGSDPESKFVGDPRKANRQGYGVYQKPIAKLANQYKSDIIDYTGHDLDDILKIVSMGKPVQVWASINLKETNICQSWIDIETGNKIEWRCNLHSMIIIGYNFENIIVSDPYTGTIRLFSKKLFEKIYNNYGKRALYYE